MTNIKRYAGWLAKMDYEGGIEGMIKHSGGGNTGDVELDGITMQIDELLQDARMRMDQLQDMYGPEILAAMEGEFL